MLQILLALSLIALNSLQAKSTLPNINAWNFKSKKQEQYTWRPVQHRVFYFLSSSCPCSDGHFDYLSQLALDYPDLEFVGFDSNKNTPEQDVHNYYAKKNLSFPIFFDHTLEMANHFKALKTPHVFITDALGNVLFQGGPTDSHHPKKATKFYLKDSLEMLKNNMPLRYKHAKAIGCYIQR